MTDAQRAIDAALSEAERQRVSLRRGKSRQVSSDDERRAVKATALTWFNNHRNDIAAAIGVEPLQIIDEKYRGLLAASERFSLRVKLVDHFKNLKKHLAELQSDHAVSLSATQISTQATSDAPPQFAPLIADNRMQAILAKRWQECVRCIEAEAPLAATVMMGGILEGLLLARINQLADKSPVFKAASAPKDKKGTSLKLNAWGLKNYMEVAHELGWISQTTRDIGEVVRDYRNFIHPQKELSHGINLSGDDSRMIWEVAKSVTRQILKP